MYNQFFTIKPRISEKNDGSKVVHLILSKEEAFVSKEAIVDLEVEN